MLPTTSSKSLPNPGGVIYVSLSKDSAGDIGSEDGDVVEIEVELGLGVVG